MLVVDDKRSEHGAQRRRSDHGRPLHCCCICGRLAPWGSDWSTYCSIKELDDAVPVPKFCSADCRKQGGPQARNVTDAMKRQANEAEWRPPEVAWREATEPEKYRAAVNEQKSHKRPVA